MTLGTLTGSQTKILREAIKAAFVDTNPLKKFLWEELDKNLEDFAGNTRDDRIFSLIRDAQAEGWLSDLIAKLQAYRPNNSLVRNLPDALRLGEAKKSAVGPDDKGSLEKIVRDGGFVDLRGWSEKMAEIGQATCRIEVQLDEGKSYGTGVLIADDLVLTNYHVVEDHITGTRGPAGIGCRFDYAMDVRGLDEGTLVSLADPAWLVAFSPYDQADVSGDGIASADNLDFAVLRLSTPIGQQDLGLGLHRGRIAITNPTPIPKPDDPVFIVQHPLAEPMMLAIGKVLGQDPGGSRLRYDADTENGSSGSGVFDQKLRLIALHHAGDPKAKTRFADFNEGIQIGKIAARLAGKVDLSVNDTKPKPEVNPAKPAETLAGHDVQTAGAGPTRQQPGVDLRLEVMGNQENHRKIRIVPALLIAVPVLAVVSAIFLHFSQVRLPPNWVEVPDTEIHRNVTARLSITATDPRSFRELQPGDIENFGKNPCGLQCAR